MLESYPYPCSAIVASVSHCINIQTAHPSPDLPVVLEALIPYLLVVPVMAAIVALIISTEDDTSVSASTMYVWPALSSMVAIFTFCPYIAATLPLPRMYVPLEFNQSIRKEN